MSAAAPRRGEAAIVAAALAGIAVLVGLGLWQLDRLAWKEGLIAERARAMAAAPVAPAELPPDAGVGRVRLAGTYRHDLERFVYAPLDGRAGYRVVTPLAVAGGPAALVDRGFVPEDMVKAGGGWDRPEGEVVVTGVTGTATGGRSAFTPDPDAAARVWYWHDFAGIAASLPADLAGRLFGRFVHAEPDPAAAAGRWPAARPVVADLPNRHREYALTWFALAVVLAVMAVLFLRQRRRDGDA